MDDTAVEILSINFYDPVPLGSSYQGWFMRVELGAPADVTFGEDWSAALLTAHAAPGATAYTLTLYEIHDSHLRQGTLDDSGQSVITPNVDDYILDLP